MTHPIVMDVIARDNASKTFKAVADSQTKLAKQTDAVSKSLNQSGAATDKLSANNANLRKSQLSLIAAQERYNKVAKDSSASAGRLASAQSSLIGAQQRVKRATDDAEKSTNTAKRSWSGAATAAAVAGVAVIGLGKSFVQAATDQQKANAQTAAVIKSTGGAAHVTAKQIGELTGSLSKQTGIQDDVIQSGANMLLTFTNVRNEVGKGNDIFTQATKVVTDMSVALGQDMTQSAIQLGKALNDPIKGVTALQRVGVTFTEQQKNQIKVLVETGNTMGAQKIILAELTKEFGGSAAAQATSAGKMAVAWDNFKESAGNALLPVLNKVFGFLSSGLDIFSRYNSVLVPVALALGGVAAAVWAVNAATKAWAATQAALNTVLASRFLPALGAMLLPLAAAVATFGALYVGAGLLTKAISGTDEAMIKAAGRGIKDFTKSLENSGGVFDSNTQKILANTLVTGGYVDKAAKAGISVRDLTAGVTGNDAAMQNLVDTWRASGKPSEQTIGSLRRIHEQFQEGTASGLANADAQKKVADATGAVAGSMDVASAAVAKQQQFLDDNNLTLETAAKKYNDAVTEAHSFTAQLGYMSNALATLSGNTITSTLQQDQLTLAMGSSADNFAGARKQVADHTTALKGNTENAINNRAWALQQIQAINQQAISYATSTGSIGKGTQALGTNIEALKTSMYQAGFTRAEVDKLIARYAATPSDVETSIREQGSQAVLAALGDILNQLHAIADPVWGAKFDFAMKNPSLSRGFARGGQVQGPGGPTADMVPIMASSGEYVVNAAATAKHRGLLENINRNKYAAGGLVGNLNIAMSSAAVPANAFFGAFGGGAGGPATAGGNLAAWIMAAIAITGNDPLIAAAVQRRIMFESGGNPNAINLWDSNAMAGDPSRGLMQTIGSTFNAYHQPGTSFNIFDPVANIAAALNYIRSRYGSIYMIDPPVQGYAAGGMVDRTGLAFLHRGEEVLPANRAGGYGGVVVAPGAITVYAAPGMDEERVARQVAVQLGAWVDGERRRAAKGGRA